MRKYQPIWELLKLTRTASIAAEPKMHPRIIKAVIKEKYSDAGWKYLQVEEGKKWKLSFKVDSKLIVFKLVDISDQLSINLNNL